MKRVIAILVLLALAPPAPAQDREMPRAVKVPFELLKTQHMLVNVRINGEGPFDLIFDTGAPVTLLNNKVGKAAGLVDKKAKGNSVPLFPGMGHKAKTLQIGDVKAADVPVVVMDHPLLTLMSKHVRPVDGIVGFSFFARYKMTIDYQAKEMTFVPTSYQPQDTMTKMLSLLSGGQKAKTKILAPAGQWGFSVEKEKGDEDAGVAVKTVLPSSAAAVAGLKAGDRLLTLDGHWTDTVADTYAAAAAVRPGTAARVVVRRDGKEVELTVTVRPGL
jgi:hypothetical protein